jgi:hypothetical protein
MPTLAHALLSSNLIAINRPAPASRRRRSGREKAERGVFPSAIGFGAAVRSSRY